MSGVGYGEPERPPDVVTLVSDEQLAALAALVAEVDGRLAS